MTFERRTLGRTGIEVGPVGVAAGYGVGEGGVAEAYERGCRYFYWGSIRRKSYGRGLADLCRKDRDGIVVVLQSYTRFGFLMEGSIRRPLKKLGTDHADVLLLGMWRKPPPPRIRDAALRLKEKGIVRHLAVSTHNRKLVPELAAPGSGYDIVHLRYNAANRGAEEDIFPHLAPREERAGIVVFTSTRWGSLLKPPKKRETDAPIPTAGDCYRFVLARPEVDVVIAGPKNDAQLRESLDIVDKGPMDEPGLADMREFGDAVYGRPRAS